MLRYEINVASPADEVLFDGLPHLQPVLDRLGPQALLVGGLAAAAWLDARPIGLPIRATRDVDLGIDRHGLGIRRGQAPIAPLLRDQGFAPGFADEEFRFSYNTPRGPFVVDLLVAKGASRDEPPILEEGMTSLAAPGLAYAISRGAVQLTLVLSHAGESRRFATYAPTLDAVFVMKATLAASGLRTKPDKRVTDTADAIMLAAACATDPGAMRALAERRRTGEVKRAVGWLADRFTGPTSAEARRVSQHLGGDHGGAWAVQTAATFMRSLRV